LSLEKKKGLALTCPPGMASSFSLASAVPIAYCAVDVGVRGRGGCEFAPNVGG
jgi:hypothetical protein